jgi:hypothetical protein
MFFKYVNGSVGLGLRLAVSSLANFCKNGDAAVANVAAETKTHQAALMEFRKQMGEKQPKLAVETGLMALDGTIQMFS